MLLQGDNKWILYEHNVNKDKTLQSENCIFIHVTTFHCCVCNAGKEFVPTYFMGVALLLSGFIIYICILITEKR